MLSAELDIVQFFIALIQITLKNTAIIIFCLYLKKFNVNQLKSNSSEFKTHLSYTLYVYTYTYALNKANELSSPFKYL